MTITEKLKHQLLAFNEAFYQHQTALSVMSALSPKSIHHSTLYAGGHLNEIIKKVVNECCKAIEANVKDTRAKLGREQALIVLTHHAVFDEYDRNGIQEKSCQADMIENYISKLDEPAFNAYIAEATSNLLEKGLSMAAKNIAESFGLCDGCNYTGKYTVIKTNKVTLFMDNPARWDLQDLHWRNLEFAQLINEIGGDINTIATHTGAQNICHLFKSLEHDLSALGSFDKLDPRYALQGPGVNQIKVYKKHVALTISREIFDAMLSFIVSHAPKGLKLNIQSTAA